MLKQLQKTYIPLIMILLSLKLFLYEQNAEALLSYQDKKNILSPPVIQKNKNQQALDHEITQTVNKKNNRPNLNGEEKNDSLVWSNAFNFSKLWGSEVDPRTGVLTAYFKLGHMISNLGHGPNINLQLNYNSNSSANLDGLGVGWSWNLTHFDPLTNQLLMSDGQSFYLKKNNKNHWYPLYHKLQNFIVSGDKSSHFVITYANGLREILSHDGYETRLEQQNGWGVNFIYQHGTHLLQSIVDEQKNSITLKQDQSYLNIINRNCDGKPVTTQIKNCNRHVDEIVFISQHQYYNPTITLYYKKNRLIKIIYPTGLEKIFTFNCTDAMKLPEQLQFGHSLCVVSTETLVPGAGQTIKINYSYSHASISEHNYLGFNSGLNITKNARTDILFEAPVNYTYSTIIDNGLVKQIHTYDKYHLLIDNKLISDHTGLLLSETENFFCNTQFQDSCSQTSFKELPSTYSLPLKIVTKVWSTSSDKPAVTIQSREYDDFGRIISSKDAYGRITKTRYCPLKGDTKCPAIPKGWPFTLLPESVTFYPASVVSTEAPVTILHYYRKQPNLNDKSYILVSDHQIKESKHQSIIMKFCYYHNPENVFTYGLIKQLILTGKTNPSLITKSIIHDYYYIKDTGDYRIISYDATELGQGKKQFHSTTTTSLFTNQILARTDPAGKNITIYHYDIFGRLIQKDLAAGTPFASAIRYQYLFSPGHNQVIITKANGLQEKFIFNNAGHELMFFKEIVSSSGKAQPGLWQLKKSFHYDAYGRNFEKIFYINDNSNRIQPLKTIKDYDDMSRVHSIFLPDGERTFMLYDDKDRCTVSYRINPQGNRSATAVTLVNRLNKPIEKRLIPASSGQLPSLNILCGKQKIISASISTIAYDGFGRVIKKTDPMGNTVHNRYDPLGHLSDTIDPDGNRTHRVYNLNGQVIQYWLIPTENRSYLLSSSGYNADGQLLFKTEEDGEKTTFTYTENGLPSTVTKPSGSILSWKYNIVGLPVTSYIDNKILTQSKYNPVTRQLTEKTDITGTTIWNYSIDGLPQNLVHTGKNGYPDYKLLWYYDNNRINIGSTDINGNTTQVKYDKFGRLSKVNYIPTDGSVQTPYTITYDNFSRKKNIHYGSGMYKEIHYDNFGRQSAVTDTLNNQLIYRWKFTYDADNNIIMLNQQSKDNQYAILNYQYDALDNLTSMHCQGSAGLPLCPRDTAFKGAKIKSIPIITRQNYFFTRLNRLDRVSETLQDPNTGQTLNKAMVYSYHNVIAPLRLRQISTIWNHSTLVTHHFNYDTSGNMTSDGEGNHIRYNAFNQIVNIIRPDGEQSCYNYDGSGREVIEKTTSAIRYFFYRNKQLINEKIFTKKEKEHIIGYQGMARAIDNIIHEYEEYNYKGDVVGILKKTESANNAYALTQQNVYSPYGMVWHTVQTTSPLYLQNLNSFDGQQTDPATGWQFLGFGHRTYNPQQRYFFSEDPLGDGYAFCSNNPVMKTDPTGNTSVFKIMGYIGTLGFGAINAAGALSGSVIIAALGCGSGIVGMIYAPGYVSLGFTIESIFGSLIPIIDGVKRVKKSTKVSKSFHRMAAIVGIGQLAITLAASAYLFGPGIFRALSSFSISGRGAIASLREGYESIELDDFCSGRTPLTALGKKLQSNHPYIFSNEPFGDAIRFNSVSDIISVRSTLQQYDNDIGITFTSAFLEDKPLNIEKLENLIRTKENIDNDMPAYQQAFKNLMSDFADPHTPDHFFIQLEYIFPRQDSRAVLLFGDNIVFVQRKAENSFQKILFTPISINMSKEESAETFFADFRYNQNRLCVSEYFCF